MDQAVLQISQSQFVLAESSLAARPTGECEASPSFATL